MFGRVATVTTSAGQAAQTCFGQHPTKATPAALGYNRDHCGTQGWGGKVRTLPRAPYLLYSELGGGLTCSTLNPPTFGVGNNPIGNCFVSKLVSYQALRGLDVDGKLGPGTLRALKRDAGILNREVKKTTTPGVASVFSTSEAVPSPAADAVAMSSPTLTRQGSTFLAAAFAPLKIAIAVGALAGVIVLVRLARR